jgi:hypothetical protein
VSELDKLRPNVRSSAEGFSPTACGHTPLDPDLSFAGRAVAPSSQLSGQRYPVPGSQHFGNERDPRIAVLSTTRG